MRLVNLSQRKVRVLGIKIALLKEIEAGLTARIKELKNEMSMKNRGWVTPEWMTKHYAKIEELERWLGVAKK